MIDSSKQVDRQTKKKDVLEGTSQAFKAFSEFFNSQTTQDRQGYRTSALQLLWEHFPRWTDLEGKVGSTEDPGDGLVYDNEQVTKATSILKDLHQAWLNVKDLSPCPPPKSLPEMGKICLILTGMKQQQLLEDFLDSDIVDGNLGHLGKEQVQNILKGQHVDYAATFVTEQYRAVPRKWEDGEHLVVEDEEPLPLVFEYPYREGYYGIVNRVRDPFSGKLYARKQQIIADEEKHTAAARKHLEDETERLKNLKHRHVIQLVKSYQRGRAYGILLRPAATSDLERLLVRNHDDRFYADAGCKDSVWLRPIFLKAFGCLSEGLAYIHGRDIRHKDVKPANILYEKAMKNNDGARFIWADFGLAYDFSATGYSKTKSNKIYSKRYAAPEVVAASMKPAKQDRKSSVLSNLDRIVENDIDPATEIELDDQTVEDLPGSHGRKTDIFSLGCVFLELLAGLVHEKLPLDMRDRQESKDDPMFSNHIAELNSWAQRRQHLDKKGELTPLFKITMEMISVRPDDRPAADDIVCKIADAGKDHFCETCWKDLPEKDKSRASRSPAQLRQAPASGIARSLTGSFLQRVNSAIPQSTRPQLKRLLSR